MNPHDVLLSGARHTTTLMPGSAMSKVFIPIVYLSVKQNDMLIYPDIFCWWGTTSMLLMLLLLSCSAVTVSSHLLPVHQTLLIRWVLRVWIAFVAVFTQWFYGSTNCQLHSFNFKNAFSGQAAWLFITFNRGLCPFGIDDDFIFQVAYFHSLNEIIITIVCDNMILVSISTGNAPVALVCTMFLSFLSGLQNKTHCFPLSRPPKPCFRLMGAYIPQITLPLLVLTSYFASRSFRSFFCVASDGGKWRRMSLAFIIGFFLSWLLFMVRDRAILDPELFCLQVAEGSALGVV